MHSRGNPAFKFILHATTAMLLLFPFKASALPDDNSKPLHINALTTLFNYKTGVNTYEGNVKIDQGTTHIIADRVITQNNNQHKISIATAIGVKNYAEYITIPKTGDQTFHAKAKMIKFFPLTSLVILEGDVKATQGENSFQGPTIIYNIKDQLVTAPASKLGRATIVLESAQLKQ